MKISKKIPHVHAEVIKAWADGHEIQFRNNDLGSWVPVSNPSFFPKVQYRVKPTHKRVEVHLYRHKDGTFIPRVGKEYSEHTLEVHKLTYITTFIHEYEE